MKQNKRMVIGALALAAVLGAAASVAHAQRSAGSASSDEDAVTVIPHERDEEVVDLAPPANSSVPSGVTPDGRTYGPFPMPTDDGRHAVSTTDDGDLPDLVAVVGDHGKTGYVEADALNKGDGSDVQNPQEALEYMENLKKNGPRSLPVYDIDGVTQIDTFTPYFDQ